MNTLFCSRNLSVHWDNILSKDRSIDEAIANLYSELPPTARVIANFIQQNPLAIISMSVSEIAGATHTSKATVSRFFKQLGYASFSQAKAELLEKRVSGFPLADTDLPNKDRVNAEVDNIVQTLNNIEPLDLEKIVDLLAHSRKISIIGYRNGYPVAMHFRQQLMQIRHSVRLLPQPGQTLSEELVDLDEDELIILIGFRRRPKGFSKLITNLAKHTTILLTDPTGQVFNKQVNHLLVCHLGQQNAFDSYAAPMSVLSVLCNQSYQALSNKGQVRVANISKLYDQLDELSEL